MPELGLIDRKAAASLAGLAPHPRNPAWLADTTPSPAAVPAVRSALYMAALVAVRTHSRFKQVYLDLRAVGKPAKVAFAAAARRIVTVANALLREDITFKNASFA